MMKFNSLLCCVVAMTAMVVGCANNSATDVSVANGISGPGGEGAKVKPLPVAPVNLHAGAGAGGEYNVRDYGATGGGTMIDSPAINAAIDAAAAAGGGKVRLPAGIYLSESIRLKSNITLYLDEGSMILAVAGPAQGHYDEPEPNPWYRYQDFGHTHWHNSLIWGENLHDITIEGPGLINGKGLHREDEPPLYAGDKAIALKFCRNVNMRDFAILNGGHFGILATGLDNWTMDNVRIDTNRDGVDLDCCRNVRVSNCSVNSPSDDGICLKSSYGLGIPQACENMTITNCQVSGFVAGTFLDGTYKHGPRGSSPTGRIKFGTESNGGYKNITISNCVFIYCRGLARETVDGGLLEDVTITNITMRDIVNSPIFLRLGSRMRGPITAPIGQLRRVMISNVVVYNADPHCASIISGIPGHDIEDLTLDNIRVYSQGGGTEHQASLVPPENTDMYPEPRMFGDTPSYGFFVRHVSGLRMTDIHLSTAIPDARPPFAMSDVTGCEMRDVEADRPDAVPGMTLNNVKNLQLRRFLDVPDGVHELIALDQY